ncbi:MAG: M1 family metallopeptidase, partial [bacterium]|nr:M1 family metallopeptidase [bacterium]
IERAEASADDITYEPTEFALGPADGILGAPLTIQAPISSGKLRIHYATSPGATAVQWLTPQQTAGKQHPFLFTQSQAIHARSWIPLQDSPAVKTTYSAKIRTPKALRAVMSAGNRPDEPRDGEYDFTMPQAIPSYLIALAVGDIEFRAIGKRTGVYSEPSVVDRAAKEFEDTERMLEAAERLFGTYAWGRYDLLVLPPSFPFGGMENPRLTFATPTVLAGDKSLVSLVAHELAHSWAGNLVTNATWSDFWLNEGFTVYLERRILEAVYGRDRAAMEATLGRKELELELARLDARDQILHVNLEGRDPDDGMNDVPYEKGCLFLTTLETAYGRENLTQYLRAYFERFAFQSITTAQFEEDLQFHLLNRDGLTEKVAIREWIHESGIPADAWQPSSDAFARVEAAAKPWLDGSASADSIRSSEWTTQEWLHLLHWLPEDLGSAKMRELDTAFQLTQTGNSEVLCQWLILAIKNDYQPAHARTAEFLTSQGRRKFLKPLYEELAKTPAGKQRALAIYESARPTYHPISTATIDEILGWDRD